VPFESLAVVADIPMPRRTVWQALSAPLAVAVVPLAGCVAVALADPRAADSPWPVCPTKLYTGVDCPGCGGLRAVACVLHGDVAGGLHYNAFALLVLLLLVWSWVAWIVGRLRAKWTKSWLHWKWTPLAVPAVLLLWFVIRILPFAPFTGLRV
jgi:hypothetical protein